MVGLPDIRSHLKSPPFTTHPLFDHSKSRLIQISDPHYTIIVFLKHSRRIIFTFYNHSFFLSRTIGNFLVWTTSVVYYDIRFLQDLPKVESNLWSRYFSNTLSYTSCSRYRLSKIHYTKPLPHSTHRWGGVSLYSWSQSHKYFTV